MKCVAGAVAAIVALSLAAAPDAVRAQASDSSDVIVAKTQPQIVLVWRTNAAFSRFAGKHLAGDAVERALLAEGERIMVGHADRAESEKQSILLKLVFFHDTDDPRYKIETLAGITPLGTLSATVSGLRAHDRAWTATLAAGRIPHGFDVDVDREALQRAAAR